MKVTMTIEVELDDSSWGSDDDEMKWLYRDVLLGGNLVLWDQGDIGDELGEVSVLKLDIDGKEW